MRTATLPPHMTEHYGTRRMFKETKRLEIRKALAAVRLLNRGSLYMPGDPIIPLIESLERTRVACLIRNWGR